MNKKSKSFRLDEAARQDLATAVLNLDGVTEAEAVAVALAAFVRGHHPIVIRPALVPSAALAPTIEMLAMYHGVFASIARHGYPDHYAGEPEQHRRLVDDLRRQADVEYPKLSQHLDTLRGLRNLCATSKTVDMRSVRAACRALGAEQRRIAAAAKNETLPPAERLRLESLARHYATLLEVMDAAGLWFPCDEN
ncbi:MAG TPA: hypothetical protein VHD62_09590 [Opitutaceae bacterium]|nr:hypothetical protein [Opitutaceae bacterium]